MERVFDMMERRYARALALYGWEPPVLSLLAEFRAHVLWRPDRAALGTLRNLYVGRVAAQLRSGVRPRTVDLAGVRLCDEGLRTRTCLWL